MRLSMYKSGPSSTTARLLPLSAIVALACAISACRGEKLAEAPQKPATLSVSAVAPARSREQAMAALMALPELKSWSSQLEKSSGGRVHGALVEDDAAPATPGGKSYWQFSFVENGSDASHRRESFLVAKRSDEILVQDFEADTTLTLGQWRKEKHPMENKNANQTQAHD
jgi:hypothetical protein